ncbi:MAG: endonuclease/exonuclease/phosphatase family protein [Bacteroidales bacterium]|nr:endonuclease/exonuclease/phosphatase family protein [Bacteroidales bacterium]
MKTKALLQIFKLLIFLLFGILISGCSPDKTTVKVMTWNIWHGGLHGAKSTQFEKDTANTINVLKVIELEGPDILFMQETYCCGMEIARNAGYPYSWRASSNLSIHSKYPIIDTINIYKPFNSQGVIIDIDGKKLMCFNIWLHYLPDYFQDIKHFSLDSLIAGEKKTRLNEISEILASIESLDESSQMPVIMGGDFNSGSHLDWIESTQHVHYNKVVKWPVSTKIIDNGFIDSFRKANPDPVKTLEGTWGYLNNNIISDRIDFIYYKGDKLNVISSKIVMDDPPGGFFNSDHRAILTVFEYTE